MALLVSNCTSDSIVYSARGVTIPAYATVVIPATTCHYFLVDQDVRNDISNGNINIQHAGVISGRTSSGIDSPIAVTNAGIVKVDANISTISGAVSTAFTPKTRVVFLTSPVALSSGSYTNVYTYSGSGLIYGFNIEFNNTAVVVKVQIDGETIFDGVSIATMNGLIGTGNDAARRQAGTGIVTSSSTIDFSMKQPIKYSSNITISADANGGGLLSRNFTQGIVYLSKET